jgi:hypothetical protein
VTVLLPCRRPHPTFLRAALTSVIGQSSGRWRLSVVSDPDDPASRREAEAALHELGAAADPRITLLVNEGRFITGAFNTGMRRAATPFVCALHGDDLLARRAIATVTRAITRSPAVDYLHSSRRYIDGDGAPLGRVQRAVAAFTLEDFVRRGPVKALHCWRVAAALAVGGMDETLGPHGADDYDFPWLMAEAGRAFQSIPQCLYYYRDHRHHYRLTPPTCRWTSRSPSRKILAKHRVPADEIEEQIRIRTAGYLRQALYRDEADARQRDGEGYDIQQGWRQSYGGRGRLSAP